METGQILAIILFMGLTISVLFFLFLSFKDATEASKKNGKPDLQKNLEKRVMSNFSEKKVEPTLKKKEKTEVIGISAKNGTKKTVELNEGVQITYEDRKTKPKRNAKGQFLKKGKDGNSKGKP